MAIIEEVVDAAPAPPAATGGGKKEKPAFIPAAKFEVRSQRQRTSSSAPKCGSIFDQKR
jgi:hypothetical protein